MWWGSGQGLTKRSLHPTPRCALCLLAERGLQNVPHLITKVLEAAAHAADCTTGPPLFAGQVSTDLPYGVVSSGTSTKGVLQGQGWFGRFISGGHKERKEWSSIRRRRAYSWSWCLLLLLIPIINQPYKHVSRLNTEICTSWLILTYQGTWRGWRFYPERKGTEVRGERLEKGCHLGTHPCFAAHQKHGPLRSHVPLFVAALRLAAADLCGRQVPQSVGTAK